MNFHRYVKCFKWEDCIRNEDIWSELQVFSITDKLKEYRHNWKTHAEYAIYKITQLPNRIL